MELTPSPPSGKAKQSDPESPGAPQPIGSGEHPKQLRCTHAPGLLCFQARSLSRLGTTHAIANNQDVMTLTTQFNARVTDHVVRAGLNYKFD